MLAKLKKWINDIFTEPDGKTMCPVRLLAIGGFLYALITHGWTIYAQHAAFDLQNFGTSFGIMLATLGASLGLKTDAKVDTPVVQS
jgi:hypothetical protein